MNLLGNNFRLVCLGAIIFFLPYSYVIPSYAIAALMIYAVIKTLRGEAEVVFYKKLSFWLPAVLEVISIFGLSYSANLSAGWNAIERQLSLLFLPFILSQMGLSNQEFSRLKDWFVASLVVVVTGVECRFLWLRITQNQYDFFRYFFSYDYTYNSLTTEFLAQPAYLGTFIVLSNIYCISKILSPENGIKWKSGMVAIVLINSFFLFQLSARTPLLCNALVLIFYAIYISSKLRKWFVGGLIVALLVLSFGVLYKYSGFTKMRIQSIYDEITNPDVKSFDPKSRALIWPCAVEVIRENWLLGVGTGDAEDALVEKYRQKEYRELADEQMNAHNQFLTQLMRFGILGGLIIGIVLALPFLLFVRQRKVEPAVFLLLIAIFFMTENVLGRAQGAIFFGFFYSSYLTLNQK